MQNFNRKSSPLSLMQTEHTQLEALLNTLSEEQLLPTDPFQPWHPLFFVVQNARCLHDDRATSRFDPAWKNLHIGLPKGI